MTASDSGATFVVERQTTIAASPDAIFGHLDDFHHWTGWSPWEAIDPTMWRGYEGAPSGVGAVYEWKGTRKAGEGRMEIADSQAPSKLVINLEFRKPFSSKSTTTFTLKPSGDATVVTWSMTGPKSFMTRVMGIFMSMDKMVGPDFEKGLAQLKVIVES